MIKSSADFSHSREVSATHTGPRMSGPCTLLPTVCSSIVRASTHCTRNLIPILITIISCPSSQPPNQPRSSTKRNTRSSRRHILRCAPRNHSTHDLPPDLRHPSSKCPPLPSARKSCKLIHPTLARPPQTSHPPQPPQLPYHPNPNSLFFLPLQLARPRKSHTPSPHPLLAPSTARPPLAKRFQTARRRRARKPLPTTLHPGRKSHGSGIHCSLAWSGSRWL